MMTRANIETFVIFQSLVGIGHLARSSAIAKAFSSFSHVTMFSGGRPIEGYLAPSGVDFIQMPAVRLTKPGEPPAPVDSGITTAEIEHIRSELLVDSYLRIRPRMESICSRRHRGKALGQLRTSPVLLSGALYPRIDFAAKRAKINRLSEKR